MNKLIVKSLITCNGIASTCSDYLTTVVFWGLKLGCAYFVVPNTAGRCQGSKVLPRATCPVACCAEIANRKLIKMLFSNVGRIQKVISALYSI